jgi:hypothetical protein
MGRRNRLGRDPDCATQRTFLFFVGVTAQHVVEAVGANVMVATGDMGYA